MKKFILSMLCFTLVLGITGCKSKAEKFNVIMTSATIPPMVSLLDTIDSDLTTYAWIGRQNTIYSVDNFKKAFKKLKFIESWSTASNIPNSVVNELSEEISNEWFKSKKKSEFNIYVTDYGIISALYLVKNIGIPESKYKIHMIEDGSGAYGQFFTKQDYDSSDALKNFNNNLAELNEIIKKIEDDKFDLGETGFSNYNLTYPAATLKNVDYYLQFPDLLKSSDEDFQKMLDDKTIKLVEKNQTKMYQNLNEKNKESFRNIILSPSTIKALEKEDKEKILMITGTSFIGEGDILTLETLKDGVKGGNFETVVSWLVKKYPNYKIIYKGHPAWGILENEQAGSRFLDTARYQEVQEEDSTRKITEEEALKVLNRRIEFLKDMNIEVLPAQTPAEAIIWAAGDNLLLAGYDSSLYMNAKPGSLIAFFENSIDDLGGLNPMLYGENGPYHDSNILYLTKEFCINNPIK